MDAAVGHQRNLVVNALSDGQPVQRVKATSITVLYKCRSLLLNKADGSSVEAGSCRWPEGWACVCVCVCAV